MTLRLGIYMGTPYNKTTFSYKFYILRVCCTHSAIKKERRLENKKFFELWNVEYRDGIKSIGNEIGMGYPFSEVWWMMTNM